MASFNLPSIIVDGVRLTGCKITELGNEYGGTRSTTISGTTCQRWDTQTPHGHTKLDMFQNPSEVENYCRNPDGEPNGPWCYTEDSNIRWEYCGIPFCGMHMFFYVFIPSVFGSTASTFIYN